MNMNVLNCESNILLGLLVTSREREKIHFEDWLDLTWKMNREKQTWFHRQRILEERERGIQKKTDVFRANHFF
jgi:hypothetical protein